MPEVLPSQHPFATIGKQQKAMQQRGLIRLQTWWVGVLQFLGIAIRLNFGGIQLVWHLISKEKLIRLLLMSGLPIERNVEREAAPNRMRRRLATRMLSAIQFLVDTDCPQHSSPRKLVPPLCNLGSKWLELNRRLETRWARYFARGLNLGAGEADPSASFWYSGCTYGYSAQRHLGSLLQTLLSSTKASNVARTQSIVTASAYFMQREATPSRKQK